MCYHWSFCAKRRRHKYRRTRKIVVALKLRSPGMGGLADTEIHAPTHMCHHVKFVGSATKSVCISVEQW